MSYLVKVVVLALALIFGQFAYAQTPVVNTTISVNKTGSEPFDSQTWTNPDLTTAGLDADADNNVVRLQDSITYKVEVSVNDADVDDLTATVKLVNKQVWINIPTGCKVDPADVTAQPVSFISADGTELFCNMGPAIEGTTKIFFPPARVVGFDPLSLPTDPDYITLNNDVVYAEVEAGADGSPNLASDGQTETIVTAFFRVNTIKEPKVNATDPETGAWLYRAVAKDGPNGESGTLVEYRISAKYVNGSMIADSDEVTFESDYDLFDFYTDDNTDNNASMNPTPNPPAATSPLTGPFSTGGILYTWDAATPACSLDGNHGPNAVVTCIQNNPTPSDYTAPNAPIGGYIGDGVDDPSVDIDLDFIDVRDPDGDGNLFEIIINIWFDDTQDILSHQDCVGTACINTILQDVGALAADGSITGFNPTSTEDASGNNLDNYNGAGEPIPNRVIYPLSRPGNPGYSVRKTFERAASSTPSKYADQNVPAGAIKPVSLEVYDYRLVDQNKTQVCDNIDISVYEFAGLSSGASIMRTGISNNGLFPTNIMIWQAGVAGRIYIDGDPYTSELYSDLPYVNAMGMPLAIGIPTGSSAADTNATNLAWHTALRDSTCDDDLNNDGVVNIKPAGAAAPFPASPIDWYEDPTEMPGGVGATTRFRGEVVYDAAAIQALNPAHDLWAANWELDLQVKLIDNGYADRNMLPNWMVHRRTESVDTTTFSAWDVETADVADYDAVNFATTATHADRNILVPSGHSVEKYTDPRGIKVVRAGDLVDFILEPKVFGLWDIGLVNTARVTDNLPVGSVYQAGSEEFSVDGGVTWLSRVDYDASSPDVTITTAANAGGADPLNYTFGSVEPGEQLPLIRYTVQMDPSLVSGTFRNTVTLISGLDNNKSQNYSLTILPEFGLDVVKTVDYPIYETNEPFEFDLIYKNLGGEIYTEGRFIDILPFLGDDTGTTSGLASDRDPGSDYTGVYAVSDITVGNGEIVYATDRNSADLNVDPCHEDNLPAGYVPTLSTELCFEYYNQEIVNPAKLPQTFVGGAGAGTGLTTWTACTLPLSCGAIANEDITALRFDVPNVGTSGGETVTVELTPLGNTGGEPNLDALGNVTSGATGDTYTNTFGGRVPTISLNVISNDVSVTVVSGSIGNYVWWDAGADGVQENDPIPGISVALLDSSGAPVYVDPIDGGIVDATYPGAIPYVTTTDMSGLYLFENLPSGTYQVQVTPPADAFQTYDYDGLGTPNISTYTLAREEDAFGQLLDVEDNDEQDFGYARNPLLTLVKIIDNTGGGTAVVADFPLSYTNGGTAFGSGVSGTAPVTDVSVPVGTYMISETMVADYMASAFVCVGGSDANAADGLDLEAFDEVTCTITNTFVPMPLLETLKGVDTSALQDPPMEDDILTYTITVQNTGNVPINTMTVIDTKLGGDITADCVFPISAAAGLEIDEIATCTVSYQITQDDIDAGGVTNTATANGLDPSGGGVMDVSDSTQPTDDTGGTDDPTYVPLAQEPELSIDKELNNLVGPPPANTPDLYDVDSVANYNYTVTNEGNTTIVGQVVVDDDRISMVNCPAGDIAPGDFIVCTGSYTVILADIDVGSVTNNADATDGTGDVTSPQDNVTIPSGAMPGLTLDKALSDPLAPDFSFVGEIIEYSFTITNSGNAAFANTITITDDQIGTFDCWIPVTTNGDLTFGSGDVYTCEAQYVVTQADLDAGEIVNIATANTEYTDLNGDSIDVNSPSDTETIDADQDPDWTLVKSTTDVPTMAGETLTYTFVLTNTGNITLNNVALSDPKCDGAITLDTATVANDSILDVVWAGTVRDVGEVHTYSCTSIPVTQGEVNDGMVENTVTAVSDELDDLETELDTPIDPDPQIALVKDSVLDPGADGIVNPGDIITYTYVVENTGNVTVYNVVVNESNTAPMAFSGTGALPIPVYQTGGSDLDMGGTLTDLDPRETVTFSATYAITQDDINAGEVVNSAQAVGQDPDGGDVDDLSDSGDPADPTDPADPGDPDSDPTVELLAQDPAIELVKSSVVNDGGDGVVNVNDTITYTYEVTNTGNVTVYNVAVSEDPAQFTGDSMFLTTATLSAGGGDLDSGVGTPTDINPMGTVTFTATYTIQQSDIDRGDVVNRAEANGESPAGPVEDDSDSGNPADDMGTDEDPTISLFDPVPQLGSTKSASVGSILADGTFNVTYTILVENTGNVTLAPLSLIDNLTAIDQLNEAFNGVVTQPQVSGVVNMGSTMPTTNAPLYDGTNGLIVGTDGSLIPGDSYQVIFTVNVNPNADNPGFNNTATAGATPPTGDPIVDDTDTGTDVDGNPTGETPSDNPGGPGVPTPIQPPVGMPALEVIKDGTLNSNGTIDYVITVENTGNVNVSNIVVSDPIVGVLTYDPLDDTDGDLDIDLLAPGDFATVTATYTLTSDDIAAGEVVNTAVASGQDPSGSDVEDASDSGNPADDTGADDDDTVTPISTSLGVAKDLQAGSPVDLGNGSYQVTYEFVISNTGILDLANLQITDDLNAMINNPNPNNGVFSAPVVSSPNSTLTPNPSYNGDSIINMLSGRDTLLVGETALLELTFVFTPDVYFGPFLNQVEAAATDPAGGIVSDLSEDGPTVNPDAASPTPFSLTTPSTPITLGWFTSEKVGEVVIFEWATEVEVSNVGFYLSQRDEDGFWQRINANMIESKGDSLDVQTYRFEATGISGTTFLFTDVGVTGAQVDHGPFELGISYGIESTRKATDWQEIERENEMKREDRERERQQEMERRLRELINQEAYIDASHVNEKGLVVRLAGLLMTALFAPVEAAEIATFSVEEAGIYQVTHSELLNHGVDLRGVDVDRIGLKQNGDLWPMKIHPVTPSKFQSDSVLLFPGSGINTLYSGENKYVLVIDEGAKPIVENSSTVPSGPPAYSYLAEETYAPQNNHTHLSPNENDSWFADSLRAISAPASKQIKLDLSDYAPALNTSLGGFSQQKVLRPRLNVELWGGTDLPGNGLQAPDHNVEVFLNGELINNTRFDGLHLSQSSDVVTSLIHGENTVDISLPKNHGYNFDIVNINSVSINYPRKFIAESGGTTLAFESDWDKFRISGLASTSVLVFRVDYDVDGTPSAYEMMSRDSGNCTSGCVYFAGSPSSQSSHYFLSTQQGRKSPAIETLPEAQTINSGEAEYLIIAHPNFITTSGSLLQNYANELAGIYSNVDIVDVDDVYASYSNHVFDAEAIRSFIRDAYANRGTRHVMFVGGDSHDYHNNLGNDSVSFIPSLYVPIAINVNAVASDASYADVDDDLIPDITIARMPVRTEAELANILIKRQRYLTQSSQNSALFAADKIDGSGYSFKADSQTLRQNYFSGWSVQEVYLDDTTVSEGKAVLSQALNSGVSLTSYIGHSSTDRWSISGLFTGEDVALLNNSSNPTVVAQWGCWNTFYTSPEQDSLAQRLLVESQLGAVTVMGATSFTKADAERQMANLLYARLRQGMRIGDAVLSAKRAFAQQNPYQLDILLGWAVLGPDDMPIFVQ